MTISAGWTDYAKMAMLDYAMDASPPASPSFWVAIFTDNADPDLGTTTECTLLDYARQPVAFSTSGAGTFQFDNDADVSLALAEAVTVAGIGLMDDDTAGNCWFFYNIDLPFTAPGGLIIPAGTLKVKVGDIAP